MKKLIWIALTLLIPAMSFALSPSLGKSAKSLDSKIKILQASGPQKKCEANEHTPYFQAEYCASTVAQSCETVHCSLKSRAVKCAPGRNTDPLRAPYCMGAKLSDCRDMGCQLTAVYQ